MYFKNAIIFKFSPNDFSSVELLEESLAKRTFVPCGDHDSLTRGFVPPREEGSSLAYPVGAFILLCLKTQFRRIPGGVVRETLAERAKALEASQGFKAGRKQMKELREAVTNELLPKIIPQSRKVFALIDTKNRVLTINTLSRSVADEFVQALIEVHDELGLVMIDPNTSPSSAMSDWLASGEAPAMFTIDRDCELRQLDNEHGVVKYVHHSLDGDDIPAHLASGKVPTKIGMTFDDRISFIFTDALMFKRLKFLDLVSEKIEEMAGEDDPFDSELLIFGEEIARMFDSMISALGGLRAND